MEAYPLPEFNIELHVTPSIGVLLVCGRIRGSLSYYAVLLILQAGPEKGLVVVDPHNGSYLAVVSVSTGCSLVSCLVEQSLPPYNTAGPGWYHRYGTSSRREGPRRAAPVIFHPPDDTAIAVR